MAEVLESRLGLLEDGETNEYLSHFNEDSSKEESGGDESDSTSSSEDDISTASTASEEHEAWL